MAQVQSLAQDPPHTKGMALQKVDDTYLCGSISGLNSVPLSYSSILAPISHCFDDYCFVVSLFLLLLLLLLFMVYGSSQARGQIGSTAASHSHSHSLAPTARLRAMPGP